MFRCICIWERTHAIAQGDRTVNNQVRLVCQGDAPNTDRLSTVYIQGIYFLPITLSSELALNHTQSSTPLSRSSTRRVSYSNTCNRWHKQNNTTMTWTSAHGCDDRNSVHQRLDVCDCIPGHVLRVCVLYNHGTSISCIGPWKSSNIYHFMNGRPRLGIHPSIDTSVKRPLVHSNNTRRRCPVYT